ncbi:head GIN domain-containing protein [Desertivirga brevis]|uniref:head GIN domain-containing protein n=1 Tax=Desertivirga brevis TaxID=2810310 RepID=UPI001A96EE05|nr:head GIN domain-containing protein [Pedobacter sp. SYSU D00873]
MKTTTILAFILVLFSSCLKDRIEANGHIVNETRNLRDFNTINLSGSKHVTVEYGDEYKVELRGSSNLISKYKTTVRGNSLTLGYETRSNIIDDDIRVHIVTPEIEELNLSGSGKFSISDFTESDRLRIRISGSGKVKIEDSFEVDKADIHISGSGEADLHHLEARDADVDISGSGEAWLGISDFLKARISGSGKVYYWGNPSVDSRISGSGKVIRKQ